jgi:hypothetical protein
MLRRTILIFFAAVLSLAWSVTQPETLLAADTDINPETLVADHLKSIGTHEVLSSIKTRVLNGISTVQFVLGMTGGSRGEFLMASEQGKLGIIMKYGAIDYPQEYFAYDGDKVSVGYISPGQRSPLADFIFRYSGPVKEGLLGGVLSVDWPLLDFAKKKATLRCRETTIDGRKLIEADYLPKKSFGDVKVKLYFDPENYHHVRSEYTVRVRNDASALPSITSGAVPLDRSQGQTVISPRAATPTAMGNQPDSIYKLVERFDDFQEVGGLTLPFTYYIDYSVEGSGSSFIGHWTNKSVGKFTNNAQIGPEFFQAQK